MYFLGLGLILLGLKWLEISVFASWDWWLVLSPFLLAVLWWSWADQSGYSKNKTGRGEGCRGRVRNTSSPDLLASDPALHDGGLALPV